MAIYYAFFTDDRELNKHIGAARQLPGAEVAFSYNHGAPGVEAALVVIADTEPALEGVTFSKVVEIPEGAPAEVEAAPTPPEVTAPTNTHPRLDITLDGQVIGTVEANTEAKETVDDEPAESVGDQSGEESREEGSDEGTKSETPTA